MMAVLNKSNFIQCEKNYIILSHASKIISFVENNNNKNANSGEIKEISTKKKKK